MFEIVLVLYKKVSVAYCCAVLSRQNDVLNMRRD